MIVLTDAKAIHARLKALIPKASLIDGAVAWASTGFDAFDLLLQHKSKIRRLVVGLHFHQTHPDFIKVFQADKTVRFLMSLDGTFHPKAYLFEFLDGTWQCLIGSANFTNAAMKINQEMAVLIDSSDPGAGRFKKQVVTALGDWWKQGRQFDVSELNFYTSQWQLNRTRLKRAADQFGKWAGGHFRADGGAAAIDIPVVKMDWIEFFSHVKSEQQHWEKNSLDSRLSVMEEVGKLFRKYDHFQDMQKEERYKVAGLLRQGDIDYGWFGSMKGAGRFRSAVKTNDAHLSQSLDRIPLQGEVKREDYIAFAAEFRKAFSAGGHGVATATRLLAMKRPDLFVCLDSKNQRQLCKLFKIRQNVDYDSYWDSIIERIQVSSWWNSNRPENGTERNVWDARAAFLDALSYQVSGK